MCVYDCGLVSAHKLSVTREFFAGEVAQLVVSDGNPFRKLFQGMT